MANRNFPNDYYAWYNDDSRLGILSKTTTSDTTTSRELYDTFQGTGDLNGSITASSTGAGSTVVFTSASHGLAVGDRISITGTTTYDGNHAVTAKDTNTFTISATNSTSDEGASDNSVQFTSLFVDNGLRYTYRAKYTAITAQIDDAQLPVDLKTASGLDSGLHPMVLCYVKARLFEDAGDIERASYYRRMFESGVHKYPLRKSGVRALAVPRI